MATNLCGECSACCTGILSADVHGHYMEPGRPCFYLNRLEVRGCAIYEDRPPVCVKYKCEWLLQSDWPKELQPNICGVIVDRQRSIQVFGKPDVPHYRLTYNRTNIQHEAIEKIKDILGAGSVINENMIEVKK